MEVKASKTPLLRLASTIFDKYRKTLTHRNKIWLIGLSPKIWLNFVINLDRYSKVQNLTVNWFWSLSKFIFHSWVLLSSYSPRKRKIRQYPNDLPFWAIWFIGGDSLEPNCFFFPYEGLATPDTTTFTTNFWKGDHLYIIWIFN